MAGRKGAAKKAGKAANEILKPPRSMAPAVAFGMNLRNRVDAIRATYGERPVNLERASQVVSGLHSGCWSMDLTMGGGWPPGRWITLVGPEGSGKSTLLYHACAQAQRRGIPVFVFDHEVSTDIEYTRNIGFDMQQPLIDPATGNVIKQQVCELGKDNKYVPTGKIEPVPSCYYYQPDFGESTYNIIYHVLDSMPDQDDPSMGPQVLFAIDSIAAMQTQAVDPNDSSAMAMQAKMHSLWLRAIFPRLGRKKGTVIAVNQLRQKPGVSFGNPEYEPGGEAIKYFPHIKIRIKRNHQLTSTTKVVRQEGTEQFVPCTARSLKNKVFRPFQVCPLRIQLGVGVDRVMDAYNYLELTKQIEAAKVGNANGYRILWGSGWNTPWTWDHATEWLLNDEMQKAIKGQLDSGEAFQRYLYGAPEIPVDIEEDVDTGVVQEVVSEPM